MKNNLMTTGPHFLCFLQQWAGAGFAGLSQITEDRGGRESTFSNTTKVALKSCWLSNESSAGFLPELGTPSVIQDTWYPYTKSITVYKAVLG